jgi:hypothetical protein
MSQPLAKCSWIEYECKNKVKSKGFCLKHYRRGILLSSAKEKGVRICDNGKRVCRNETFNNKMKCEECLNKTREKGAIIYKERKEKGLCVMCGVIIEDITIGIKEKSIQKCEKCYATMRKVEDKREFRERNYAFEKKINPLGHYREYADGAAKRNLSFELTLDEFTEIVTKACYYCKKYEENEVIGIDRINSFIGYNMENIVPCCNICNTMKQQLTMNEFALQIEKIYSSFAKNILENKETDEILEEEIIPSRRLRPKDIVSLYSKKKLDTYIELCKSDERSLIYIQKLIDSTSYTMTVDEFRKYLENASRTEIRSQQLTLQNDRKRVPRKEIYSLFHSEKYIEVVKLYESVFGKTKGIQQDMKEISTVWKTLGDSDRKNKLETLFIKYNNMRAYKKRKVDTNSIESLSEIKEPLLEYIEGNKESKEPEEVEELEEELTEKIPSQWKITNIYKYLTTGSESIYLEYVKQNNPDIHDLDERVATLLTQVKIEGAKPIKAFILELRNIRHNALCYENNNKLINREDREVWRTDTILRGFNLNQLENFKQYTEKSTGDSSEDPAWCKRWGGFVNSVKKETNLQRKKTIISNFLTAQRTKKYRRSKNIDNI